MGKAEPVALVPPAQDDKQIKRAFLTLEDDIRSVVGLANLVLLVARYGLDNEVCEGLSEGDCKSLHELGRLLRRQALNIEETFDRAFTPSSAS